MAVATRRRILTGLWMLPLAGAGAVRPGQAQSPHWPTRAVRVVVPVAAGTATDLTARIYGDKLAALWGQAVVVENKPGADGMIAINSFVAAHDDHTLLFGFSTAVTLNPLLHARLSYAPSVDLPAIATTSEVLFAIAVHTDVRALTLSELTAELKANPGRMNWAATPGLPRFVLLRHLRDHGLDMAYVAYHQVGPAVQDLGEGRIHLMIASLGPLMPVIEAGKARVLAIASAGRAATMPEVPHVAEAGYPDLVVPAIGCMFGWKDMPDALRIRLAREIDTVAQDAALIAQLGKVGIAVRRTAPADLDRLLAEQRVSFVPLAAVMNEVK